MDNLINNIKIIDGNVSAFDEICDWYTFLDKEDITYVKNKHNNLHYAFDCKLVKLSGTIVGYYYGIDYYILENDDILCKYDKVYEIYDFSIDCEENSLKVAIEVLKKIIEDATLKGCKKVVIKKNYEEFNVFYNLCLNHLNMKQSDTYIYFDIVNYKKLDNEKYFIPSVDDKLSFLNVVYLSKLNFEIKRQYCFKTIDNYTIQIDRKTGVVNILNKDIIYKENEFYSLIEYIIESIEENSISDLEFNYQIENKELLKHQDSMVLFGINYQKIFDLPKEFILSLKGNGVNKIKCYNINMDKFFTISSSKVSFDIDKIIKRFK